jgi:hypothetical protein
MEWKKCSLCGVQYPKPSLTKECVCLACVDEEKLKSLNL